MLNDGTDRYSLGRHLEYFEDKTNQLSISDITSESFTGTFKPSQTDAPNFGHTLSDFWVRTTLRNESASRNQWLLEIQAPRLIKADVYLIDPVDGSVEVMHAQDFQPYAARAVPGRNFNLKLALRPGQSKTLFVNAQSTGTLQLPLVVWAPEAFAQADHHEQLVMGVYYGVVLAILLINLLAFFTIRDTLFLFYAAYLASFGLLQFTQNGHALEYTMPSNPDLIGWLFLLSMALSSASAMEFTRRFLHLPTHMPRTGGLMRLIMLLWLFQMGMVWLTDGHARSIQLGTLLTLLTAGTLLFAAVRMRNRIRQGRYFLLAWSGFLVGVLALGLRNFDILPNVFITTYGMQIGSFFEFLILTYALIDRIRATKKENERIQQEALQTLEKRVQERTRELVEQREMAEQATRFKSEFLANMSHEIRTPMNAIVGLAHLAQDTELSAKQRGYMSGVTGAARSLLRIIEDILDFSKIEAGKLQLEQLEFDLGSVVENISMMTSLQAQEKGLALIFWMEADVHRHLKGDAQRLGQVLLNLVNNAIKFTDAGEVRVHIGQAPAGPGGVRLVCSVADTGIGISPQEMRGLFQSFNQADSSITRRFGGTGLGLAISQQLVQAMGGRIQVHSSPGGGSTFTFTAVLPSIGLRSLRADAAPGLRSGWAFDGKQVASRVCGARVLVVEDHEINRLVLQEMLQNLGATCHLASSGREAIAWVLAGHALDLVLMDLQMPDMSGLQACREIRSHFGRDTLPIIALTAQAQQGQRQRCLDAGMNDYLTKPVDPGRLMSTIAQWIKRPVGDVAAGAPPPPDGEGPRAEQGGVGPAPGSGDMRIPGFEGLPLARARVNHNEALLRRLILSFQEKFDGFGGQVRAALDRGDEEQARNLAHALKSVAGTLGADGVEDAAGALGHGLDAPDEGASPEAVAARHRRLASLTESVEARLRQAFAGAAALAAAPMPSAPAQPRGDAGNDRAGPSPVEMEARARELSELLAARNVRARQAFEAWADAMRANGLRDGLDRMGHALEQLDFERAQGLLDELSARARGGPG